ncbi:MAG: Gldg family protein, partial [Planctomycetota bacterium]
MIPLQSMLAVFRRNFIAYFVNPTGYVFITLFILLSAIAAFWRDGFFASNLANLDQLNGYFPLLILFFVPALTMNVWSEERRAGTDELLFTLPAHDADIVIGKYLAVLGIYTVAILFSLSHIVVLSWLGDPDLGLMAATYLGYWCTGAALLAVGMVGSFVARNATVAFLLGALLCSLFVILTPIQSLLGPDAGRMIRVISIEPHFETMAEGAISGGSLVYFIAVAACALIFNIWCAVRRRSNQRFFSAWSALSLVRGLAIVVIAGCVFMLVERSGASADLTSEKLHTLQPPSRALMTSLPDDRPVLIQAYLSPTMPEAYVGRRKTVVNLLRTLDALGGERVQVAMFDTEPFTERATAVSENYGIVPRRLGTMAAGQRTTVPVYFGLVFTSGPNELVIPFLDRGLPAEYEIVRSIQTVSRTKRKVVGVLDTDVSMFGGVDFRFNVNRPDWSIIRELRKQYDVRQVQVEGPYPSDLDALVAVMPSS